VERRREEERGVVLSCTIRLKELYISMHSSGWVPVPTVIATVRLLYVSPLCPGQIPRIIRSPSARGHVTSGLAISPQLTGV